MPDPNDHETASFITKFAIYVLSVFIGLGAKLAIMSKDTPLTWRIIIRNSFITAMAVWIVWNVCDIYQVSDNARYIYGVVAAKFSDSVILFAWDFCKQFFSKIDAPK